MRRTDKRTNISKRGCSSLQMFYSVKAEEVFDSYGVSRRCYGIAIVTFPKGEQTLVNSVTTNRSYAFKLARILSRCAVTPTTVHDVVYDWLCENAEL